MVRNHRYSLAGHFLVFTSVLLWSCRTTPSSQLEGVPTIFPHKESIDLTTFKEATEADYHNMLLFLRRYYVWQHDQQGTMAPSIHDYAQPFANALARNFPDETSPFRQIPVPELFAIQVLANSDSEVNERLWNIKDPKRRTLIEGVVKSAAAGINKLPIFVGPVLHVESSDSAGIKKKYVPGKIITEDRFLRASFENVSWGNVRFIIHSKTGRRVDWLEGSPWDRSVVFTPGNQFFVHSINRQRGIPQSWDPDPEDTFLIVLEQVFPDSDKKDCCSLDERWDDSNHTCRYRFSRSQGTLAIPYGQSGLDYFSEETDFAGARCSANQFVGISDWTPKSLCPDGACFAGYEKLNMITDDFLSCRKGKKLNPDIDFYKHCSSFASETDAAYSPICNYFPDPENPKLGWDAYEHRVNYKTNEISTCTIAKGKVSFAKTNSQTKEADLETLATSLGLPEISDPEYWLAARGLAADLRETEPKVETKVKTILDEAAYLYVRVAGVRFVPFYLKDYNIGDQPDVVEEKTYDIPEVLDYRNVVASICKAMAN